MLLVVLVGSTLANGQAIETEDSASAEAVRVFLDCELCDFTYLRQEIPYVNYVRDARQSQVHVFVTSQSTASGGREILLSFIGREDFTYVNVSLTYTSVQGETQHERRRGLAGVIKTGLVPFLAIPLADSPAVQVETIEPRPLMPISDSWNNWVFEIYGGGNYGAEATTSELSLRYGISAHRVTEAWKIRFRPYGNTQRDRFQDSTGAMLTSTAHRNGLNVLLVKSLSDHWSTGVAASLLSTTYDNKSLSAGVSPAVEYSVYPYREAGRREVTFAYRIGAERVQYYEETIFGRTQETLPRQSLEFNVRLRRPWGSFDAEVDGSHLLRDVSVNRVDVSGRLAWRVLRGLSLTVSSRAALIHDQLFLPRGAASVEEVLLRRRTFATSYRFSGAIGFSYTFGSIYNNVVNPRL